MLVYVGKKVGSAIFVLWSLVTFVFLLSRTAPGDPVAGMIGPGMPLSLASQLRHRFGLDQPLPVQYLDWLKNAMQGDLGISFGHQRDVGAVLAAFFPNTLILASSAIVLEMAIGLFLGYIAARKKGTIIDRLITGAGTLGFTVPAAWVGMVLLSVFSYTLRLFPASEMHSLDADLMSNGEYAADLFRHLTLPALTIAIPGSALILRYFRSSMINIRFDDHLLFARSMGLSKPKLFWYHTFPNALGPVITLLGLEIGILLTGAVVTETLFGWPGMGRLAVQAILSRDYPLVMGCTLVACTTVIGGNLLADLLYAFLDPRVRLTT